MAVDQKTSTNFVPPTEDHFDLNHNVPGSFGEHGGNVYDILGLTGGLGLSPTHRKYIEDVTEIVKGPIDNIEVVQLQNPRSAHAFCHRTLAGDVYAYIVVFEDLITLDPNLFPISDAIRFAIEGVRRKYDRTQVHVVNSIMVSDKDLVNRAPQMANAIITNILTQAVQAIRDVGARALSTNLEWVVDNNLHGALDLYSQLSPKETLPAADFGFTLSVRSLSGRQQNGYAGYQQAQQADGMISCLGYVDIVGPIQDPLTNIMKYLPLVHISGIASRIPTTSAILMAIVQMTQFAIMGGGWKIPFKKFQPGTPNLGNLRISEADPHKLWFAENADMMEQFIRDQMFPPALVIDVQEGDYRIPGLFLFAGKLEDQTSIVAEASRFFGSGLVNLNAPVASVASQEFTGTIGDATKVDSRTITYLNQAAKGAMDGGTSSILLSYQQDPSVRARKLGEITGSFRSLYRNQLALISSDFQVMLSNMVRTSGLRIWDPTAQTGIVPLSGFIQMATNFTGFQNFAYQRATGPIGSSGHYNL